MGKDNRPWRKLVKKLRRKRIRQEFARRRDGAVDEISDGDNSDSEVKLQEEAKWLEREKEIQLEFEQKQAEEQRRKDAQEAEKERIWKEWEELQAKHEAHRKEMKRLAEEKRQKQEQELKEFLDFLAGDIENPPLPYLMPEDPTAGEVPICPWYARTAACRFSPRCNKSHPKPTMSRTILISNFFSHISLERSSNDDTALEYEDSELYREFLVFYYDVLPEFKSLGEVIQFKVCCNFEPHLRGNVYVQFKNIREAVEVYRKMNGRFFNGKQLSLEFVKIDSWRSAICGMFQRKRCPKKRTCNYLHVFRNPTKEFVRADNDWKIMSENTRHSSTPRGDNSAAVSSSVGQNATETCVSNSAIPRVVDSSVSKSKKRTREDSESTDTGDEKSKRHKREDNRKVRKKKKQERGAGRKDSKKHKKSKHKHKKKKRKTRSE